MPDQQLDRQAAQQRASEWLGRRKPAASASLKADEFAATVLDYEAALAAAEQERDEWRREAHLSKWPKEAAQEYNRMKVDLPEAERRAVRAEEQLVALADAATRFRDHLSRRGPIRFAIADDGSCPGCDAWNTFCDALTAASVAGGGQAVEPAAEEDS